MAPPFVWLVSDPAKCMDLSNLTAPDGRFETFKTGDTFFVPKETKCVRQIAESLRKLHMIAA